MYRNDPICQYHATFFQHGNGNSDADGPCYPLLARGLYLAVRPACLVAHFDWLYMDNPHCKVLRRRSQCRDSLKSFELSKGHLILRICLRASQCHILCRKEASQRLGGFRIRHRTVAPRLREFLDKTRDDKVRSDRHL